MEQLLILLVVLAGVTHAFFTPADTNCNTVQNSSVCSATLGGSVYIHMMTSTSARKLYFKKQLSSGPMNSFNLKKETEMLQEEFKDRAHFFFNNRTFKISNLEVADSGQYIIEDFDQNGVLVRTTYVTLTVQGNSLQTLTINVSVQTMIIIVAVLVLILILIVILTVVLRRRCCNNKKAKRRNVKTAEVDYWDRRPSV